MSEFHTEVQNLEAFAARFKSGDQIVSEELASAGRRAGVRVELNAKQRVKVWRRELQRSITSVRSPFGTTVSPLLIMTKIGTNKKYAKATEFGRPADAPMPPPGALLPWMASKGIPATDQNIKGTKRVRNDKGEVIGSLISGKGFVGPRKYLPIEYLIARAIKRSAPKPSPYLIPAFTEERPRIKQDFVQARKQIIARLKGGA